MKLPLENIKDQYYRLNFLIDKKEEKVSAEIELSVKAGGYIARIHDLFLKQYKDPNSPETLKSLNKLCVRLVFCFYAEDAYLFPEKNYFQKHTKKYTGSDYREAIIKVFKILDVPEDKRDPYIDEGLNAFPYVNGGLFKEENIEIPRIDDELREAIIEASEFDWSQISPTIFGAVFESTLNPETRRAGGMHYTSIENIHKVIDPLFLDDLNDEFNKIKDISKASDKTKALKAFQDKLATLKFLDPACGSGNFLTETYVSLRRLENKIILELNQGQGVFGAEGFNNPIKVSINQFYGIEINDFAVTVAKTALWIAESQMMRETQTLVRTELDFLPLKTNATIVEGNALRIDWETVVSKSELNYIIGNPPFVGRRYRTKEQQTEISDFFKYKDIDYVACWYKKAAEYINGISKGDNAVIPIIGDKYAMQFKPLDESQDDIFDEVTQEGIAIATEKLYIENKGILIAKDGVYIEKDGVYKKVKDVERKTLSANGIQVAFVSTNSICQGEQVTALWKELFENYSIKINFAYTTFKWNSEASDKAAVYCIIVGFSNKENTDKTIYVTTNDRKIEKCKVTHINGYLLNAPDIFIENISKPLCDVPTMKNGNVPLDGDALKIEPQDYDSFKNCPFVKRLMGGQELLHNQMRYVLWLVGVSPTEIKKYPNVVKRVDLCRQNRLAMKDKDTQKLAERPTTFRDTNNPDNYIALPMVSSERRRYVPMDYLHGDVIPTNQIQTIPEATLYHFGVLTSNVHMSWMRAVCGRLEMRYRYSKDIVYNNFPWPTPTPEQKAKIETTAQGILDARALYPDSSLADLYDPLTMPAELKKAHQANDKAVMEAYNMSVKTTSESECVAYLMNLYRELTKESRGKR